MFKVLHNRCGDKATIAFEIIGDLERFPPLKSYQPRRAMELIQTIEKAPKNLTKLGSIEVIKNPLMVRSIESKLPDDLKRSWLMFVIKLSKEVTPENCFDSFLKYVKE